MFGAGAHVAKGKQEQNEQSQRFHATIIHIPRFK
jgi:hypothetical protein